MRYDWNQKSFLQFFMFYLENMKWKIVSIFMYQQRFQYFSYEKMKISQFRFSFRLPIFFLSPHPTNLKKKIKGGGQKYGVYIHI